MFESIENYTKELENNVNYSLKFLQQLQGGRTRLVNSIEKAEEATKSAKNETKYVADLKKILQKDIVIAAKNILFSEAMQAIRESYEFDEPPYRNALFHSIENNETYLVRPRGSGFKSIITVDIDLNRTAGRLNFWAAGVKAYRKILEDEKKAKMKGKSKKKNTLGQLQKGVDAIQASRAWAGIFERRSGTFSKFSVTVRERLQLSGMPAPFWQILDKGNDIQMRSNRGGYPTPSRGPSNFVDKAEKTTNEYISNLLAKEKEKYDNLMFNYQTVLDQAKVALAELDNLVSEIRLDYKQLQSLGRRADKVLKANYITKLEKAVQLIREGLISAKGLQTAVKGSYKGKRFSIETMAGLLQ